MLLRATACHDEVASGTKAKLPLPTSFLLLHNIHTKSPFYATLTPGLDHNPDCHHRRPTNKRPGGLTPTIIPISPQSPIPIGPPWPRGVVDLPYTRIHFVPQVSHPLIARLEYFFSLSSSSLPSLLLTLSRISLSLARSPACSPIIRCPSDLSG